MGNCVEIYYGLDGKPSPHYYEVLKTNGKEAAEASYVQHMLESNIKFSKEAKESPRELLDKMQVASTAGKESATAIRDSFFKTTFDKEKVAKQTLLRDKTKELEAHGYDPQIILEKLNDTLLNNKDKLELLIKDRIKEMDASAEGGTAFHKAVEQGLKVLVKEINRVRNSGDGEDKLTMDMLFKENSKALYEISKNSTLTGVDGSLKNVLKKTIDVVNILAKRWGVKATDLDILPEYKISSDAMNMKGIMDVFITDPKSNNSWILEYKTKGSRSYENLLYSSKSGYKTPLENRTRNFVNDTAIQVSVYGAAAKELGFDVQGGDVIAIRGYTKAVNDSENIPIQQRSYRYIVNAASEDGVTTIPLDLMIQRIYEYKAPGDFEELKRERESSGMFTSMKRWAYSAGEKPPEALESISNNEEKYIKNRMNGITKTDNGDVIFFRMAENSYRLSPVRLHGEEAKRFLENIDDYKKELKENYNRFMTAKRTLPSKIVSWFNAGADVAKSQFGGRNNIAAIEGLLRGLTPEDYTLYTAADFNMARFGEFGDDVLIAVNKHTHEVSFLDVLAVVNKPLNFHVAEDTKGTTRTNIFGRFVPDGEAMMEHSLPNMFDIKATLFELYSMKLATVAMIYQKYIDTNAEVGVMRIASITGDLSDVKSYTMGSEIEKLRKFRELDTDFPPDLGKLLDDLPPDPSLLFSSDKLGALAELLSVEAPKTKDLRRIGVTQNADSRAILDIVQESKILDPERSMELIKRVSELYKNMYNTIGLSRAGKIFTQGKDGIQSRALNTIREALMSLINVDTTKKHILMEGKFSEFFPIRSLIDAPDYMVQKFATQRQVYFAKVTQKVDKQLREHKAHLDLLKKAGIKYLSKEGNKNFYISPEFKKGEENFWMLVKDPDNMSNNLSKEERTYLRYFIKESNDVYKTVTSSAIGQAMIAEGQTKGVVPIFVTPHTISTKDFKSFVRTLSETLTPRGKEYVDLDKEFKGDTAKAYSVKFENEIGDGGHQYSETRRDKLGISTDVEGIDKDRIETRLPIILHYMQVEAAKKEYLTTLTNITNAMIDELYYKELKDNWKTDKSVEFIKTMYEMTVNNSYKNETIGKKLDKFRSLISTSLFSFNIQQMSTETFTAGIRGTSIIGQQALVKLWGGRVRFSPKDATWASRAIFAGRDTKNDFIYQMALDAQILHSDVRELVRSSYTKLDKVESVKRALIMGGNTAAHNQFRVLTFTAMAKHDGVADAYRYNSNGEKVYDETANKNFYVYDPNVKIEGAHTKAPKEGTEDYRKWKFWKGKRAALAREGMVDEKTHKMLIPYTAQERSQMSDYISRTYGSMRDDAKTMWDYLSIPRQFTLYKRWIGVKFTNYWTPRHPDVLHMTWKEGENDFTEQLGDMEGIIQTIGSLAKRVAETRKLPKFSEMNNTQIENLAMLTSDMMTLALTLGIGAVIVSQFKDTLKKSPVSLAIFKGYTNAFTELNLAQTLLAMNTEVFPALSLGMGVLNQVATGTVQLTQGDVDGSVKTLSRLQSYIGPIKTIRSGLALFDSDFNYDTNKFIPIMTANPTVNPLRAQQ